MTSPAVSTKASKNRVVRGGDRPVPNWVERPQRGEDDLDGGAVAGGQPDLPAGGCEAGAVAITEGEPDFPGPLRRHSAPIVGSALVGNRVPP
jgi:hypothetical protein